MNDLPRQVENRLVLSRSGRPWLGFSLQGLGLRLLCLLLGLPGGAVLVSRDNRRRLLRGPNREFNWPIVDQEFNQFALQQLDEVDTLLLGASPTSSWPATGPRPPPSRTPSRVAAKMNDLPKLVVSPTLQDATWATQRRGDMAGLPPRLVAPRCPVKTITDTLNETRTRFSETGQK